MTFRNPIPYAHADSVQAGDILYTDGGFVCMHMNEAKQVYQDEDGLWIVCDDGKHHLDGQDDGDGLLIGLGHEPNFWLEPDHQ